MGRLNFHYLRMTAVCQQRGLRPCANKGGLQRFSIECFGIDEWMCALFGRPKSLSKGSLDARCQRKSLSTTGSHSTLLNRLVEDLLCDRGFADKQDVMLMNEDLLSSCYGN